MKKTILLASLLWSLSPLSAQQKKRTATAIIKTSIHCDHCKRCESCGGRFERELYAVGGVKQYEINMKDTTLTVIYNPLRTNPSAIKLAITKMGFDADEMKANTKAYEKLDECCKK
ncbi:hypothetical protein EMGBS15_10720 [Filimonas sp.]|nr:hypothetical protein EMGBS15_10720 [Filimonas sp.]